MVEVENAFKVRRLWQKKAALEIGPSAPRLRQRAIPRRVMVAFMRALALVAVASPLVAGFYGGGARLRLARAGGAGPRAAEPDAFEMAAAEALADEISKGLSERSAVDRLAAIAAAEALDAATAGDDLDAVEAALAAASAAGVGDDAPEVVAALAARERRLAAATRDAVVDTLREAADCDVDDCDVDALEGALEEARELGLAAESAVAAASSKSAELLARADLDDAAAVAAALIFHDEAHDLYDDARPPPPPEPDAGPLVPDL